MTRLEKVLIISEGIEIDFAIRRHLELTEGETL